MDNRTRLNRKEINLLKSDQKIAAIREWRTRTGGGLKEGLALANAWLETNPQTSQINTAGVRDNADGSVTIQFRNRSAQLESIADEIDNALSATDSNTTLRGEQVHKFRGYMEQLRIIADELKRSGK